MEKEGTSIERSLAARQIRLIRSEIEKRRDPQYKDGWDRDMIDYIIALGGFKSFLTYVEGLGHERTVLDIGSGTFRGITEIANTKIGKKLNFIATSLSRVEGSLQETSPVKVKLTSAETLRGINDESVNGVITVSSIAYSKAPVLVASSIDRVLVPGGAIKSAFRPIGGENDFSVKYDYKTHHRFSDAFRFLGYDVAIRGDKNREMIDECVMVAIKPGGNPKPYNSDGYIHTAEDLALIDTPMMDRILNMQGQL